MTTKIVPPATDAAAAETVARVLAKFPSETARILRGAAIAATTGAIRRLDETTFVVKSTNGNGVYTATNTGCDCPDALGRGVACKHQWAVAIIEIAAKRREVLAARANRAVVACTAGV